MNSQSCNLSHSRLRFCMIFNVFIILTVGTQALGASGTIIGWGAVTSPPNIPTVVAGAAGYEHGLALKEDGFIATWGGDEFGQRSVPAPNAEFTAVAAGLYHSLGLKADGSIVAWGANGSGQCDVPLPNEGFTAISAGEFHSVGLKVDGSIVAWGSNDDGQCDVPYPNTGFRSVSAGRFHNLALKSNGSVVAWGRSDFNQCRVPLPNSGFSAVAAGYSYSMGLKVDGSIVAWGKNDYGQCNVPSPNTGFLSMAGGYAHSLAVRSDGSIAAWGANNFSQCSVPPPNAGYTSVAVGFNHSVGVKGDAFALAVYDVPADQGGQIRLSWRRHFADPGSVDLYDVQRYAGDWMTLASVVAAAADTYGVDISTPDILTVNQPAPISFYRLIARKTTPGLEYATSPVAGYSMDNLPPPRPDAFLVDELDERMIMWARPDIPDFASACVYRGEEPGFVIGEPVACPSPRYFLESDLAWYFYRVQFSDTHGNLSELSEELHGRWPTPVPNTVPTVLRLYPCQPNPFNPRTTIRYDLPKAGAMCLSVFDLAGRLVRTLVDESMPQGSHEAVWDGRDSRGRIVGSGSYLARLQFGGKVETVRLGLVR